MREVPLYRRASRPAARAAIHLLHHRTRGGSEAGSFLRLIDFVYHSTLGLRVTKKKTKRFGVPSSTSFTIAPEVP